MRILIVGINYAPEPVGIGPYTSEMAAFLAKAGHRVEVVAAHPYYPGWSRPPGFPRFRYIRSEEEGVRIVRCPLYVPRRPTGVRRIAHHLSFALSILPPVAAAIVRRRPELVMTIAPSLASIPVARLFGRISGARTWLHIQDFEVGAALATGLLDARSMLGRFASWFEKVVYRGFDRYSSISPQMCLRLTEKASPADKVIELRNWSDVSRIRPMSTPSPYRDEWNIGTPHVALYSGNIANKQGVDMIVDAARRLRHRRDLTFVVCGEGPRRNALVESAGDLDNIRFHPLQPRDRLDQLLGLATVHLLPQLASAADLVLPSKLTNMLASGRPVVATAAAGTGLAIEVEGCGAVTEPGDADRFASAIECLVDDPAAYSAAAAQARVRAEQRWSKQAILDRLDACICALETDIR